MLRRFWLEGVKQMVLHAAGHSFTEHLQQDYPSRRATHINRGEIDDWPITEHRPRFPLCQFMVWKCLGEGQ